MCKLKNNTETLELFFLQSHLSNMFGNARKTNEFRLNKLQVSFKIESIENYSAASMT